MLVEKGTIQERITLVLKGHRDADFVREAVGKLKSAQVLVRSQWSSFKHGTELAAYKGSTPFHRKDFDTHLRVFVEKPGDDGRTFYPRPLGSMTVGVVKEIGTDVTSLSIGDIVYGWLSVADWHVSAADNLQKLNSMTPMEALCVDPAMFALGGVMDGDIRPRDKVFITGLGAIGLLAVQYAKLSGASVYAASSFHLRRQRAREYGADVVLDSDEIGDLGLAVKQITDGGVDVALECSGNYASLQKAMRAVRQCGRVVCVGFYSGECKDLNLGEEFFHNRLSLLASLPALRWNNPVRGERALYAEDLKRLVIEDLETKRLKANGLLHPKYSFSDSVDAMRHIASHPESVIKALIEY